MKITAIEPKQKTRGKPRVSKANSEAKSIKVIIPVVIFLSSQRFLLVLAVPHL
jgi:hypothetical protein